MKTKIEKLPKSAMKLTVTVENSKIKEFYEKEVAKAIENTEVQGFRKGTAPREMVIEKVGDSRLYGDTINEILQVFYPQALKEHKAVPVSNPKVEIKEFDIDKDLEFTAEFAVRPEVKVKDYKKAVKKYYDEKKKKIEEDKLEKLKKGELKPEDADKHEYNHAHIGANEVIEILLENSDIEIADILTEEEVDRQFGNLTKQLETISLPIEKYLEAQGKTVDEIRDDFKESAEKNIKTEFILSHLIKEEGIDIDDSEIDEMINAAGDPTVSEQMKDPMQRLYIKTILQKNKLLNQIIDDIQGSHEHSEEHGHKEEKKEEKDE